MRRALSLALAIVVACGSDATEPQSTLSGDYVLQTLNGQALPYTWTLAPDEFYRIYNYRLSITPASGSAGNTGTWKSAFYDRYSDQGQVIDRPNVVEFGSYAYTPSTGAVSLLSHDERRNFTGQVSADLATLTLTERGDVWVFRR